MRTDKELAEVLMGETAEALGLSRSEIRREAWLKRDLGAESIDLIDLTFRFEKALGKALKEEEIFRSARPDGDFSVDEVIAAVLAARSSSGEP